MDDLVSPFRGVERDAHLRPDSTVEKLAKLKPVFGKGESATMTAGNSTPLSDGASAVLLASEEWAKERGLPVLAYLSDFQTSAVDYIGGDEGLLMAPAYAVSEMLERAGLLLRDPRGVRRSGALHVEGLGGPGLLQGAVGSRRAAGSDRSRQVERQRLLLGGRAPLRGDWRSNRASGGQVARREGQGSCVDLDLCRRWPGHRRHSRALRHYAFPARGVTGWPVTPRVCGRCKGHKP